MAAVTNSNLEPRLCHDVHHHHDHNIVDVLQFQHDGRGAHVCTLAYMQHTSTRESEGHMHALHRHVHRHCCQRGNITGTSALN